MINLGHICKPYVISSSNHEFQHGQMGNLYQSPFPSNFIVYLTQYADKTLLKKGMFFVFPSLWFIYLFPICAGLSILVLGPSSASGPCGLCRRMRSYWLLMAMITNQQGRTALRPPIGISRSCRSFSRDNRLPLANKNTDEFWKIKHPSLPVLQLYKSPAALWHLISPTAANSITEVSMVVFNWNTAWPI